MPKNIRGARADRKTVALDELQRRTISSQPTENFEAYSYCLQGEAIRTGAEPPYGDRHDAWCGVAGESSASIEIE